MVDENSSNFSIRKFDVSDSERVVNIWEECGLVRDWNNRVGHSKKTVFSRETFLLESLKINLLRLQCLDMMGTEAG